MNQCAIRSDHRSEISDLVLLYRNHTLPRYQENSYFLLGFVLLGYEHSFFLNFLQPQTYIKVSGHTDITGDHKKNVQLFLKGAEAVRHVFISWGIPDQKISAQGFGPDQPINPTRNKTAYRKNRSVELNLISENASPKLKKRFNRISKPAV